MAEIITFNNLTKNEIEKIGAPPKNISVIFPAIKLKQHESQDNIFSGIARADTKFNRKFFTIGTEINLNKKQKIETLFSAVKNCLPIIPNIQLIIIGEGEEKKNIAWLAKKMGLETIVWFVGAQNNLNKWVDNLNIYIMTGEFPAISDFNAVLKAMAGGLPVIGPKNAGLEDIVYENKTGVLLEADNGEMLARQIIKLHRDKRLRLKIGELAKERVELYFTLEKQINEFKKII